MNLISLVAAIFLVACIPPAQTGGAYDTTGYATATTPTTAGTGIYINGQQLTAAEQAQLEALVGEAVPAGRYALDAQGNFGYEGQPPAINLAAYVRARQEGGTTERERDGKQPFSMYSTDSAGNGSSFVSDGDCMIMSTPSGSLSSGC